MTDSGSSDTVLVLDTASPTVSIAIARNGEVLAEATLELRQTSEQLLSTVERVLGTADLSPRDLDGVAALQGPGSFTGLRIGLATVLGWHQALGVRATALPTLPVVAAAGGAAQDEVIAAVDAIRGDWSVQRFRVEPVDASGSQHSNLQRAVALDETILVAGAELDRYAPCRLIGFGVTALDTIPGIEVIEPPPLAATAARLLSLDPGATPWDVDQLTRPIYARPPAVTPPKA